MTPFLKYISSILILIIVLSCEEPSPIELVGDEDAVEIKVVNSEPNSYVITGYDSTGIPAENSSINSLITLSGIKNTFERITYYKAYAQAVFYDTTQPVFSSGGLRLGYKTFDVENVKFNDKNAVKLPLFIKFRENLVRKDSLIGNKYAVSYRTVLSPDNLDFNYNTNLNVEVTTLEGNTNNLQIRVPDEIIGNVAINDNRNFDNSRIVISWNKSDIQNSTAGGGLIEEVIIGGIFKNRDELVPLLRLGKFNVNRFEIPVSLMEDILSSNNFDYLVFTFLRIITNKRSINQLGEINFVSQSIHNIWIKL